MPRIRKYIASDGAGAFINTGVSPSWRSRVEVGVRMTGGGAVFGVTAGKGARFGIVWGDHLEYQVSMRAGSYATVRENPSWQSWNDGVTELRLRGSYSEEYAESGDEPRDGAAGFYKRRSTGAEGYDMFPNFAWNGAYGSLWLFAMHDTRATAPLLPSACEISYFRLYDYTYVPSPVYEGQGATVLELKLDLLPALDDDDTPCFWDAISGRYYYNAGSGALTAGPAADSFHLLAHNANWHETLGIDYLRPTDAQEGDPSAGIPPDLVSIGEDEFDLVRRVPYSTAIEATMTGFDVQTPAQTEVWPVISSETPSPPNITAAAGSVLKLWSVWRPAFGWLVRDADGVVYQIALDGEGQQTRTAVGVIPIDREAFWTYGCQFKPAPEVLTDLVTPEIYSWAAEGAPAGIRVTLTAVPPVPQLLTYPTLTLRAALKYLTLPADPETLWNVSFDAGETWQYYDPDEGWQTAAEDGEGCKKHRLELLDASDWEEVCTGGTVRLRCWIPKGGWTSTLRADYDTDESEGGDSA